MNFELLHNFVNKTDFNLKKIKFPRPYELAIRIQLFFRFISEVIYCDQLTLIIFSDFLNFDPFFLALPHLLPSRCLHVFPYSVVRKQLGNNVHCFRTLNSMQISTIFIYR